MDAGWKACSLGRRPIVWHVRLCLPTNKRCGEVHSETPHPAIRGVAKVEVFLQRVYSCEAVLHTRTASFCSWCRLVDSLRRVPALHVVYRPLARTDPLGKTPQNDAPRLSHKPSTDRRERQKGPLIAQATSAPLQIASSSLLHRACPPNRLRLPRCGCGCVYLPRPDAHSSLTTPHQPANRS